MIHRDNFEREPTKIGPLRTQEAYKNSVRGLSLGHSLIDGVKPDSVFNRLRHFHVCKPVLPPRLGHDLFEGIVSTDLALYIKHFVSVKHFTYTQLNRSISQIKLVGSDASNQPCEVVQDGKLWEACSPELVFFAPSPSFYW